MMIVNQKQLAQCLGISSRQVRNLKAEGMFQPIENGKGYSLENCIQEFINYKIQAEMGRRASISKEAIQAEHEEVKKQISLLRLRKLRRELHEAADVEAFLSDMLARFKNRLLSLPPKMAMQISGEKDVNKIIQSLLSGIAEALEELSEYDPDEIDGQKAGTYEEMLEDEEDEDEDEED